MSRIGKKEIIIPEKVNVVVSGNHVAVKGAKGSLSCLVASELSVASENGRIIIQPRELTRESRSKWGLCRTIVSNMVTGVSLGFTKRLEFTGVGYKAAVSGRVLNLSLGYSHPIDYQIPDEIEIAVKANSIEISGPDKEMVGLVAAKIRDLRGPEPYKGKGIRYADEVIIRKAGKTGAK